MKERPILFSEPMVRALLSGAKSQTRRIVKDGAWRNYGDCDGDGRMVDAWDIDRALCPYGQAGDRLWVRETWTPGAIIEGRFSGNSFVRFRDGGQKYKDGAYYRPENYRPGEFDASKFKWKPSIHMSRWACRLVLEITDVRVERLQDISREDATAEGVDAWAATALPPAGQLEDPRVQFALLWQAINGATSLDANPWVWALTFRRLP